MNFIPFFKTHVPHINWVIPLTNLFLCAWFLYAYLRHRTQFAFLIWSFGGLSASVVSTYLLCSHLQQELGTEVFPAPVWRTFAYLSYVLGPAQFVAGVLGAVVLVCTYGSGSKPSRKRS